MATKARVEPPQTLTDRPLGPRSLGSSPLGPRVKYTPVVMMSANTSPKLKLLLVLEQSQT
jgi:hypothetical protein